MMGAPPVGYGLPDVLRFENTMPLFVVAVNCAVLNTNWLFVIIPDVANDGPVVEN